MTLRKCNLSDVRLARLAGRAPKKNVNACSYLRFEILSFFFVRPVQTKGPVGADEIRGDIKKGNRSATWRSSPQPPPPPSRPSTDDGNNQRSFLPDAFTIGGSAVERYVCASITFSFVTRESTTNVDSAAAVSPTDSSIFPRVTGTFVLFADVICQRERASERTSVETGNIVSPLSRRVIKLRSAADGFEFDDIMSMA